ncbi:MAG: SCP2 sterol-binding domain-containing protein [Acidimicrobiia bacterium]|nr:SCP2 sterol-binding domain-containing protein [Acidimicrobiia bacterium]
MTDISDANSPEALAQLLEGRSDEEISEFVNAAGVDAVLAQVFDAMKQRLDPQKAAGQSAVVQWDINAADGSHSYQFKVDNGSGSWTEGTPETPRVTLTFGLPDFLRFVAGQLEGMQAFMAGKLRLAGDMMFATTLQTWFNT